ncbi:MAG: hypothetical protein FWH25_03090 [Syntrophorhabdaceae bacterium]|nr:hypothetical protein [Syntrophorhabdaceae bacterium]
MNCQDSYIFLQRQERWGKPPNMAFSMFSSDKQFIAKMSVDNQWWNVFHPCLVVKCLEVETETVTIKSIATDSHDNPPSVDLWDATGNQIAMATLWKSSFWNINIFLIQTHMAMYDSPKRDYWIKGWPFCNSRNIFNQDGKKVMDIKRMPIRRLPSEISNVKKEFPKAITYKVESDVQYATDNLRLIILWATIVAVGYSMRPDGGN